MDKREKQILKLRKAKEEPQNRRPFLALTKEVFQEFPTAF